VLVVISTGVPKAGFDEPANRGNDEFCAKPDAETVNTRTADKQSV